MYARGTRHMAYIRFPFNGDDLTGALHVLQLQFTTNSIILAPTKSRTEAFCYRLTQVVLENGG